MPKPFPGMDPYLEDPVAWRDLHHALCVYIRDRLTPQLRPRYAARLDVHYVTDYADGSEIKIMYPDVDVIRQRAPGRHEAEASAAGAMVATTAPPLLLSTLVPSPEKLATIEIRETGTKHQRPRP